RPGAERRVLAPGRGQATAGDLLRGPGRDVSAGQGHRQAAGRRNRRRGAQGAPAGALQGQGNSLRGRVRETESRQESVIGLQSNSIRAGGTSRFSQTPSIGPLTLTGGCAAGKRASWQS